MGLAREAVGAGRRWEQGGGRDVVCVCMCVDAAVVMVVRWLWRGDAIADTERT